MAETKLEHDGKRLTISQWSKETGLSAGTIRDRLKTGWGVDKALTTGVDCVGNRGISNGKILRTNITASLLKVWEECGREEFEKQLAQRFHEDAIKVIQSFQNMFPREVDNGNDQKPVAAITINTLLPEKDFGSKFVPIGG